MLVLNATTDNIQVVLAGAITTNQLQCFASYRDITTTAYTPGRTVVNTNSTTDVNVVPAPASSTQRVVDYITIYNADTVAATVTLKFDANGTENILFRATLQVGETMSYVEGRGWAIINASGALKTSPQVASAGTSVMMSPFFSATSLAGTKTITSNSTFALYMGKAPRALTSVQIRLRVTTAAATITWVEAALAKGNINVGGNPTLTVVGFADTSATYNSTGQKTTTINVSSGQAVNEGDDLWVLIGNQATTALVIRGPTTIADDIQVGIAASLATRPSLNVGNAQAYTIEGATTIPGWIALIV